MFFGSSCHIALQIWDRNTIPYSFDTSQDIFLVHVPVDYSTHQAFCTIRLHFQTSTVMDA